MSLLVLLSTTIKVSTRKCPSMLLVLKSPVVIARVSDNVCIKFTVLLSTVIKVKMTGSLNHSSGITSTVVRQLVRGAESESISLVLVSTLTSNLA